MSDVVRSALVASIPFAVLPPAGAPASAALLPEPGASVVPGALLVLIALATPAALATAWTIRPLRGTAVTLAPFAALPALALALWPGPLPTVRVPEIFLGIELGLDAVGKPFLLFSAALWTAAGVSARASMAEDRRRNAFFGLWLLTLTGNIGAILARDALAFYLFFAVLTFAAYGLIVHRRNPGALSAGRVYIIMAVLGEAAILSGLLLLAATAEGLRFADIGAAYAASPCPTTLAGLFLGGFGIKVGVVPLHLWLPLAHPVAPTPASALLSGALIEAGVLAWLRFLPIGATALPVWGEICLVMGFVSAFFGVAVGLTETDPKTVLAYSSISQMGFLLAGVGIGLYAPADPGAVLLAVGLYAVHHGLAKGALFLGVETPPAAGRARWWHATSTALAVIPALALAGAPLTSGALAKHALSESAAGLPPAWSAAVAPLLSIAAAATTLLMARYLALLGARPRARPTGRRNPAGSPTPPTSPPPPARLWLPWAGLVLVSATGVLWIPLAVPAPAGTEVPTAPGALASGIGPVALGALIALIAARYHDRLPFLAAARIPPGDVLVPIRSLARRLRGVLTVPVWFQPMALAQALFGRASRHVLELGRALGRRDPRLTRGVIVGTLLFLLLVALRLALGNG